MRPKRVYKQGVKYYYIINGKRKYIKMPKKLSDKQIININIKTGDNSGRKIKKRKRRKTMKYTKKVDPDMTERATSAVINYPQQNVQFLPATLYQPRKNIESVTDKAESQTKLIKDEVKKEATKQNTILMIKDEVKKELDNIKKITNILETDDDTEEEIKKQTITDIEPIIQKWITTEPNQTYGMKNFNAYLKKNDIKYDTSTKEFKDIFKQIVDDFKKTIKEKKGKESVNLDSIKSSIDIYLDKVLEIIKDNKAEYIVDIDGKDTLNMYASNKFNFKAYKNYLKETEQEDIINDIKLEGTKIKNLYEKMYRKFSEDVSGGLFMEGKGHNANVDGLWNTDIEKIVEKKINNIVPVIAADGGNELMPYIKKNMPSFSFIINRVSSEYDGTGSNGQPSGHWISVFINNNDDFQSCEIYDSLADVPSTELIKLCKKICKMINPQSTFKLKINHLKNQSNTTETCGYHAIKFLEDRNNGIPWSEATNYDSYIEKLNNANNETDGENKLHKVIDDYNLYL